AAVLADRVDVVRLTADLRSERIGEPARAVHVGTDAVRERAPTGRMGAGGLHRGSSCSGRRCGVRASSATGHEQRSPREDRGQKKARLHASSMVETVGVESQGSASAPRWWRSPHWRKAPFVLFRHRSVLASVAAAGLLVALAASSGPLVTAAAA